MTELLAPAGSFEALRAAIANGADAVYLGGKSFSARAFADNFTLEDLAEAVKLCHFHGVKVYVAVNTLIADQEMVGVLFYASELYKMGVDAVIVQDIGLIGLLSEAVPGLPLHASTQMTVHDAAATRLLGAHGVSRAILARELSFSDIAAVREAGALELETFVHGALCVCYSGQCLFSSLVGGRSGNRGRCAQPCRMVYHLTDGYGDRLPVEVEGRYLLSPRDLFGYQDVEELYELDLAAWKIEGRMKKPQYVATVCRIYSRLLRELQAKRVVYANDEELRQLMQVFNRDRSSGYWHGNPGAALMSFTRPNNRGLFVGRITEAKDGAITVKLVQRLHRGDGLEIWQTGPREGCNVDVMYVNGKQSDSAEAGQTVRLPGLAGRAGDRVFKTYDAPLMEMAEISYRSLPDKPLSFHIDAHVGRPVTVSARDKDGYFATRTTDYVVERAHKPALPMNIAATQLGRLGGSGYYLSELKGEIDEDALLPASVLNQARRELVDDLFRRRCDTDTSRPFDEQAFSAIIKKFESGVGEKTVRGQTAYSVLVHTLAGALAAARRAFRDIYFDVCGFAGDEEADVPELAARLAERGARLIPYLPQIILPREEDAYLRRFGDWRRDNNIGAVVVNNLGQLALLRENGWDKAIYAGSGLNVFNSASCAFLAEEGVARLVLSPEMTLEQIRELNCAGLEAEIFAQGALQLMVSEYCLPGAVLGGRNRGERGDTPCSQPCRKRRDYGITDEKGYRFPLRPDPACRMHIFNSREHCLLEEIPALRRAGVERLLLDLRLYDERRAGLILDLYKEAAADSFAFEEAKRKLPGLIKEYTKGHLYRGV